MCPEYLQYILTDCCSVSSLRSGQRPRRAEPVTAEEQKSISLLPERHAEMQLGGYFHCANALPLGSLQQLLPQRMLQHGNWAVTQVVGPA